MMVGGTCYHSVGTLAVVESRESRSSSSLSLSDGLCNQLTPVSRVRTLSLIVNMLQDGICDTTDIINNGPAKKVYHYFVSLHFSLQCIKGVTRVPRDNSSYRCVFVRFFSRLFPMNPRWSRATRRYRSTSRMLSARRTRSSSPFTPKQHCPSSRSPSSSSSGSTRSLSGCTIGSRRTKSTPVTLYVAPSC